MRKVKNATSTHKRGKSSVSKVFNNEGVFITAPKKILSKILIFHSNLCKQDHYLKIAPPEPLVNSITNNSDIPNLADEEDDVMVN